MGGVESSRIDEGTGTSERIATCLDCGYDLNGLSGPRCPECGRAFDLADATTFQGSGTASTWRRWAKAPGPLSMLAVLFLTLLALVDLSSPEFPSLMGVCTIPICGVALLADYIVRLAATKLDQPRARNDARRGRAVAGWALLPLCLLICALGLITRWPLSARFALSRAAFETQAQQFLSTNRFAAEGQAVGLYTVDRVFARGENVEFRVGRKFVLDFRPQCVGFEFAPTDRPSARVFHQLAPHWYAVEW